jgi:hypothetical protein
MPKAAIDKHSEFCSVENEIRLTRQRRSAPPAGDAVLAEQCNEAKLGSAVPARTNA